MSRPRLLASSAALLGLLAAAPSTRGQDGSAASVPGRFVRVDEPITSESTTRVRDGVEAFLKEASEAPAAPDGSRPVPVIVFEFRPGETAPGATLPGAASDLSRFLLDELNRDERSRVRTVAFVPESLRGYAVLPALSCDDLVLGPAATLGPITPENKAPDEGARVLLKAIAEQKRRQPELGLFLGMLDPSIEVRRVRTADKQVHFVPAADLAAFRAANAVVEDEPAWERGNRGVLDAESVRGGLVKLEAAERGAIRKAFALDSTSDLVAPDAEAGELVLSGPITRGIEGAARRYLAQEAGKGTTRIFVRVNSPGGDVHATTLIIAALRDLKGVETIAYVEDEALGMAALIPLACRQIVFKQGAKMGDVRRGIAGRDASETIDAKAVGDAAEAAAEDLGHPAALARGMVDPEVVVVRVRDKDAGGAVYTLLESEVQPGKHEVLETIKPAGEVLTLKADEALALGLAARVVDSDRALWAAFNLSKPPTSGRATWVDNLVSTLNDPWMSGLLLFVGLFMLILELKLPGVGLPAILSALAFLLFFWSHYLGGTADQLEILLFLVGIVCLALELFVFPGFAVFGLSGILLILISVVMASHTFVWPTRENEYREMGRTLMEVTGAILTVSVAAVALGRYFPSLPLFRRMVLQPPDPEGMLVGEDGKPLSDGESSYFYLLGEVGRATTALKPTGKARFGEALIDVTADGFYIDANAAVEVVEVQGAKVIVKRV